MPDAGDGQWSIAFSRTASHSRKLDGAPPYIMWPSPSAPWFAASWLWEDMMNSRRQGLACRLFCPGHDLLVGRLVQVMHHDEEQSWMDLFSALAMVRCQVLRGQYLFQV